MHIRANHLSYLCEGLGFLTLRKGLWCACCVRVRCLAGCVCVRCVHACAARACSAQKKRTTENKTTTPIISHTNEKGVLSLSPPPPFFFFPHLLLLPPSILLLPLPSAAPPVLLVHASPSSNPNIVKEYEFVTTPTFALVNSPMPCYRVMDQNGVILPGAKEKYLLRYL